MLSRKNDSRMELKMLKEWVWDTFVDWQKEACCRCIRLGAKHRQPDRYMACTVSDRFRGQRRRAYAGAGFVGWTLEGLLLEHI